MPTVPRVTGPRIEQQGLPGVRTSVGAATADAFGGNTGAAITQLGKAGEQAAVALQYRQDREDADMVFRAETGLKTDYLQFEREELNRFGVNAKGAAERANKWWGEAGKKYTEGLSGGRQQQLFERSFQRLQLASTETLMRHEQAQLNRSLQESATARVSGAIDLAAGDPTPERVAAARGEILSALDVVGKLAGHTPEIIQASKAKYLTQMHKSIVMTLVDRDPDAAKAHYYGNKKEIEGSERAVIEKALDSGSLDQKAQEVADELMSKFTDEASAIKQVELTYSGKEEVRIKQELAARFNLKDATLKKGRDDAYDKGRLLVAQGQKVPQSLLLEMGDGHAASLLEHQQARIKAARAEANGGVKTDFSTYDMLNRLSWQKPAEFAAIDLGRFADKLSPADMRRFSEDQQKVGSAEGVKGLQTRQQQITTAIDQLKLTGEKNAEKRGLFTRTVNDAIEAETRNLGRPLKYDEIQKVVDQQTLEMTVVGSGWFFDDTKRAFELTPEERAKAAVTVPDYDRDLITQALRAAKRPVTDVAIRDLYMRKKGIQ